MDGNIHDIQKTRIPSLVESLWSYDQVQMDRQLQGIIDLPSIEYVAIIKGDNLKVSKTTNNSNSIIEYQFPLSRKQGGRIDELGVFHITLGLDHLYFNLLTKGTIVLLTNAFKTFLVATFILLTYQLLVGRYIAKIAEFPRDPYWVRFFRNRLWSQIDF